MNATKTTKATKATKRTKKPSGVIVWQNKLIALIMVIKSSNSKTGNMVQTHIIRKDKKPTQAINDGSDRLICGDCPHRKNQKTGKRTCYVNVGQGPNSVYKKLSGKNPYPKFNPKIHAKYLQNRMLRIGSYGDPAMVPYRVWKHLLQYFARHTGYTHQWHNQIHDGFKLILMASCDSKLDLIQANLKGYRGFLVTEHNRELKNIPELNAIPCVNSTHKKQCEQCGLCNGNPNGSGKNIFIPAHGTSKRFVMNLA